jgi:hypothetical protein
MYLVQLVGGVSSSQVLVEFFSHTTCQQRGRILPHIFQSDFNDLSRHVWLFLLNFSKFLPDQNLRSTSSLSLWRFCNKITVASLMHRSLAIFLMKNSW